MKGLFSGDVRDAITINSLFYFLNNKQPVLRVTRVTKCNLGASTRRIALHLARECLRINRNDIIKKGVTGNVITERYKPILLNIPLDMLGQLDCAAKVLGITRSDLIRKSLARDLAFVLDEELALAQKREEQVMRDYKKWAETGRNLERS